MASAWLDFGGFKIDKDNKNKIESIKILNAKSSKEEDFITFAALLRYFLNKNNFSDGILIELTSFTNELNKMNIIENGSILKALFTETYDVMLKTAQHNNKRYLEIETQGRYWYADINTNIEKRKYLYEDSSIDKETGYYREKFKDYFDKKISISFDKQKKQIPEFRAQIWLEALNKYHV